MTKYRLITLLSVLTAITACDPGLPGNSGSGNTTPISGYASALTQGEFNALTPEQQFQVANKLTGSFLRGISAEDFFDLSAGLTNLQLRSSNGDPVTLTYEIPFPDGSMDLTLAEKYNYKPSTFLDDMRRNLTTNTEESVLQRLAADMSISGVDSDGVPVVGVSDKYLFDNNSGEVARQIPLARMREYPISHDMLVQWMAYFLSNTIQYSPAEEMETADIFDVQAMFRFLVRNLTDERSVREMISSNLPSLQRWRVSRSAENHALEAYELYLGLFETEEDSIRGGIACKDLYLTPENQDYLIGQTNFPNINPQLILESYYVTTCSDLYNVVAGHSLIMPRAVEVLMNYFMSGRSQEDRLNMIQSIAGSGVESYEDIFIAILFSREYLLNTERPKSFEESFIPMLDRLRHSPDLNSGVLDERIYRFMTEDNGSRTYINQMGWDSMSFKIGRLPDVPLDGLSFGNYHKGMREEFLMNRFSYQGSSGNQTAGLFYDEVGDLRSLYVDMTLNDLIDLLFLNALNRRASDVEKTDLTNVYTSQGHTVTLADLSIAPNSSRMGQIAEITYDYISRLPEFYYFTTVN